MTRPTRSLRPTACALAVLVSGVVGAAVAAPPAPWSFPFVAAEDPGEWPLTGACFTGCVAVVPGRGTLLCLEHRPWTNCMVGGCRAAWAKPGAVPTGWVDIVVCEGMSEHALPANIDALERAARRRGAVDAVEVFDSGEFASVAEPLRHTHGPWRFEVDAEHLRVWRDETAFDAVPWNPEARRLVDETARVRVYEAGARLLAVIDYTEELAGLDPMRTRWVALSATRDRDRDATPLARDPELERRCRAAGSCPLGYAATAPYLAHVCAGTLTPGHLAAIEAAQRPGVFGAINENGLVVLFNVFGAMYGYRFTSETWLNELFYGAGEWLPEACRPLIRAFPNARAVPRHHAVTRDAVKDVWRRTRRR